MPHLYCLRGDPWVLWMHVVSDLAMALAYLAIPLVLIGVVRARKDSLFRHVLWLFAAFIAACATTHLLAVWTIWIPVYRFEGVVKALTAILSIATALVLIKLRPILTKLPTMARLEAEIEERLRAEHAAQVAGERLAAALESVEDYAVYSLDPNGLVKTWGMGAERLKGYTAEEIVGKNFSCFYSPEDVALGKPREALRVAAETGRFEGQGWRYRKDGGRFWAHANIRPQRNSSGDLIGFTKVTHDLTESREVEVKFQVLLEAAPDAILIINRRGGIDFVNAQVERLFGYTRAELQGKSADMLNPQRLRGDQVKFRERIFDDLQRIEVNADAGIIALRKDGSEFPIEFTLSPLDTRDGWVFLIAIRDVSARLKSEMQFSALMEAVPDAILMYARPDRITYVNRGAEEMFGYDRAELLGQSGDVLIPKRLREERRNRRPAYYDSKLSLGLGMSGEHLCLAKDGSEFAVEVSINPFETPDGPGFLASIRNITQRKKTEARFGALLESAPDAMVIVDSRGLIEMVNLQTEKLFGYAGIELVGLPIHTLVPLNLRGVHGGQLTSFFANPTKREMGAGLDLMATRKDGSQFPVEISLSPLEGPDGISVTAAIRDITDRKKPEIRFRALLDSAPDAMVIVKSDGLIELANMRTEELFGYSRSELVGRSVDILVPEIREAVVRKDSPEFLLIPKQRKILASLDVKAVRKDGTEFPVEITLSPLESADGTSVTAAIRDVTERKKAADQLAGKIFELSQSNEALEQFAHITSHDLQEPLRMVASYTQLLAKRYVGRLDADADEFIGYAVDGTQRMKRLIEDLLLYSRVGHTSPPVHEFSSESALKEALDNLRQTIQDSSAQITHDPLPSLVVVDSQLVQLFQNLIGNAIKYRGDRIPKIHISASLQNREWIFSVSDNGIGIDPKYFDRIFLIFQRLHGRGQYEGTGIGLAICKRIVQQHGGRIWVESDREHGSNFLFALPLR